MTFHSANLNSLVIENVTLYLSSTGRETCRGKFVATVSLNVTPPRVGSRPVFVPFRFICIQYSTQYGTFKPDL